MTWKVTSTGTQISEENVTQVSRPWTVGEVAHKMGTGVKIVYCRHMNKTTLFSSQNLQDLQDFMFDTMASSEMAVDWFCDRFNVNADDDVIDFVLDAHDAFFGN